MEIVYERCAGLDVHKKNVKACFSGPGKGGHRTKETRTSLTMTQTLLEMRDWLRVTRVYAHRHGSHRSLLEAHL